MQDNDRQDEPFEQLVRQVLESSDPPPSEVAEIAKLAFGFRDVEVVELGAEPDRALVRSAATEVPLQAANGDGRITWSVGERWITGVAFGITSLEFQTVDSTQPVAISSSGVFEIEAVDAPYRWLINRSWATPWSKGV